MTTTRANANVPSDHSVTTQELSTIKKLSNIFMKWKDNREILSQMLDEITKYKVTNKRVKVYVPSVQSVTFFQNPDSPTLTGPKFSSDEAGDGPPMFGTPCTITYGGGPGTIPGLKMKMVKQTGVLTSSGMIIPTGPTTSKPYAHVGFVSSSTAPTRRTGGMRRSIPVVSSGGFAVPVIPSGPSKKPITSVVIIHGNKVLLFKKRSTSGFAPSMLVLPGGQTSRYHSERVAGEKIMEHHTGIKLISGNKFYPLKSTSNWKYWYMPVFSLPRSGVRIRARYVQATTHSTLVWLSLTQCLDHRIRAGIHPSALIGIDTAIGNGYLS